MIQISKFDISSGQLLTLYDVLYNKKSPLKI